METVLGTQWRDDLLVSGPSVLASDIVLVVTSYSVPRIVFVVAFGGTKVADVAQTFWLNVWAGSCTFWNPSFSRLVLVTKIEILR